MREHETVADASGGRTTSLGLVGAVVGAVVASVCCLGPLVLVTLGATGAWIGGLAALAPYRSFFILATLSLLGFAFYREYRKPRAVACEPGSACAVPAARRGMRVALWVVAGLVLLLLALPYAAPGLVADGSPGAAAGTTATATLAVQGMTCEGCVATVTAALTALPGVSQANVTLEPPHAVVTFDPARVTPERLAAASDAIGYPATVITRNGGRR